MQVSRIIKKYTTEEQNASGTVQAKRQSGDYEIRVGSRLINARNATESPIIPGLEVLITKTTKGWRIIGTEGERQRSLKEVLIYA